jgi:hypothetical protein
MGRATEVLQAEVVVEEVPLCGRIVILRAALVSSLEGVVTPGQVRIGFEVSDQTNAKLATTRF